MRSRPTWPRRVRAASRLCVIEIGPVFEPVTEQEFLNQCRRAFDVGPPLHPPKSNEFSGFM
jgi:hypothetical protein